MKNRWSSAAARAAVSRWRQAGAGRDVALCVHATRLLGAVPELVLHGGGNTSVKTQVADITGEPVAALCVKGSGWNMASIEPPGLPAVRLAPLLALKKLPKLGDGDMADLLRRNLLDPGAPNPSVETLLHAFLPHRFVFHTHADAVLALTDQPDGARRAAAVFGERAPSVPYVMPGFALAKAAARVAASHPEAEGLVLLKHGIFSFADDARAAYDRMIALVSLAERAVARGRKRLVSVRLPRRPIAAETLAPFLRGAAAALDGAGGGRFVATFRGSAEARALSSARDLARLIKEGPVTPDHVIRIKPWPLRLPVLAAEDAGGAADAVRQGFAEYAKRYRAYVARQRHRATTPIVPLDPVPRVVLVPGLGLFALGRTAADAGVAADLAETNARVVLAAERLGRYRPIPEGDLFDMEYWSLEQAKLGKAAPKPLAGRVAAITGGGSGIGAATARAFRAAGAEVAVLDLNGGGAEAVARAVGGIGLACDVTRPADVARAFGAIARTYGGLDILVSNAGAAFEGRIGEVAEARLRQSFELNFFAHQTVAQAAVGLMRAQGTGGCLLFNVSKQALNPGPDFGPYGLPKAATLALMRQYAVDHGGDGIRANAVNADRIRSGLLTDAMIARRARARGTTPEAYLGGNLLKREVTAEHVARAFVDLALAERTTGAILTVDGGNIAAAPR